MTATLLPYDSSLNGRADKLCQDPVAFFRGVNTIGEPIRMVNRIGVEIDHCKSLFLGDLLLDGHDLVIDDLGADPVRNSPVSSFA